MRRAPGSIDGGSLPFVGRRREIETVLAFATGPEESPGLRIGLITGEAGIGKSRLVQELLPPLRERRAIVAHAKFHPETPVSLTRLLVRAVDHADIGQNLLAESPSDTPTFLIAALRRYARLRPTLLILEDVENIQGEGVAELRGLLGALADDQLNILCLSRPVELEVRGVLERYLRWEIALETLRTEQVGDLWERTFSATLPAEMLAALMESTQGNPLALRSALRGALHSGALRREPGGSPEMTVWRPAVPLDGFATMLDRSVGVVSQGLAAHLGAEEREIARRLAPLGETFSREAAGLLLDDAAAEIDRLIARGVIATSTTSTVAINGAMSRHPLLTFTHGLLHRHFVDDAIVDPDRLLRMTAASPPLYSILPFQYLIDHAGGIGGSAGATGRDAILVCLSVALQLDRTAAWQKRVVPWGAATALIARFVVEWEAAECADMQAVLIRYDFFLHARNPIDQRQLVARMLGMTEGHDTRAMAEARMVALAQLVADERADVDAVLAEVDRLRARIPGITADSSYCFFLGRLGEAVVGADDSARMAEWERRVEETERSPALDEEGRRRLLESQLTTAPHFATEEDLRNRFALLERLERAPELIPERVAIEKARLLLAIGHAAAAATAAHRAMQYVEERGLREEMWRLQGIAIAADAVLGADTGEITARAATLLGGIAEGRHAEYRREIGRQLATIALLRGDTEWLVGLEAAEVVDRATLPPRLVTIIAAMSDDASIDEIDEIAREVIGEGRGEGSAIPLTLIERCATTTLLRLDDILLIVAIVHVGKRVLSAATKRTTKSEKGEGVDTTSPRALRARLVEPLRRALAWCGAEERRLATIIAALLEEGEDLLDAKERKEWRARLTEMTAARSSAAAGPAEHCVRITMLGTIEVEMPGGEPQKITGLRMRTLIGLLVAGEMLRAPLDPADFCLIASGAPQYDKAARVSTNGIVWRLREMIGHDAIDTDGEIPRFNRDRVVIDLIEARDRVAEGAHALRANMLRVGVDAIVSALEIVGMKVPFPSLYDDLFEALRADIETSLQDGVVRIARELMREEDHQGAATLLSAAAITLPGDGEIMELLATALSKSGQKGEAEKVRMAGNEDRGK